MRISEEAPVTRAGEGLGTPVQECLFLTIFNSLLRVLVLMALENRCKHGDLLHTKLVRDKTDQKKGLPGAVQKNLQLALPFLIEPGREVAIDL